MRELPYYSKNYSKIFGSALACVFLTLTCFQLAGEAEDLGVVRDEVLVQLAQDQQLWPPVLGVERGLLQLQETVPGSLQGEA